MIVMTDFVPFYPLTRRFFRPHCSYDTFSSDSHERGLAPYEIKKITGYDIQADASGVTVAVITAFDNIVYFLDNLCS